MVIASAMALASAQTDTAATASPVLPPPPSVGDVRIDAQIRALNQEMELKIRSIRQEYQTKLKALIGSRKAIIASSTRELRGERKGEEERGDSKNRGTEVRNEARDRREGDVRGTSTPQNLPKGNAWGFFQRFFGLSKGSSTDR